jgi:PPE-repeat protein
MTDRHDEIGAMAEALNIFKENMLTNDRLMAEQAAAEMRAAEDKKKSMNKMANDFKPLNLLSLYNEISLDEIQPAIEQILQGKLKGRTIIKF